MLLFSNPSIANVGSYKQAFYLPVQKTVAVVPASAGFYFSESLIRSPDSGLVCVDRNDDSQRTIFKFHVDKGKGNVLTFFFFF